MRQCIRLLRFAQPLFDTTALAEKGARILEGILAAGSPRLSQISQHMTGHPDANYKMMQRFLACVDMKSVLLRLFQADAPFVIGNQVYYKGRARVNIIGAWKPGRRQPMWVMTDLEAQRGLALYQERMKIEIVFTRPEEPVAP